MRTDTLYVTDLDGTLLNSESRVSDRSARIISELVDDGAMITIATARTPATVEGLLEDVYTTLPAIVLTGAAMWDRDRRRYLYPLFIDESECSTIMREFRSTGVNPFIYTLQSDGILHVFQNGPMVKSAEDFMHERDFLPLKKFHLNSPLVESGDPIPNTVLFFGMGKAEDVYPLADRLRTKINCAVYSYLDIFNPDVAFIEVFSPKVSKAEAVKRLAKREGASRIVVFGDSSNDLTMFKIADLAVAVDNAIPEVKKLAHKVIGTNSSNSVAEFIKKDYYSTL